MEFVKNGQSMTDFMDTATQEEISFVGNNMIRFMFTNLFKHKLIYTDFHYGNFIIEDKKKVHVLDFGSVHYVDETLHKHLFDLLDSIYMDDEDWFFQVVEKMGIIDLDKHDISEESTKYMWDYFRLNMKPWITVDENFTFTDEWVDQCGVKNMNLMKEWLLPSNVVWLNKFTHGFTHILAKMKVTGNYIDMFRQLGVYDRSTA